MPLAPTLEAITAIGIELTEWDGTGPIKDRRLKTLSLAGDVAAQMRAKVLRGRLDIRESYDGLEISTTSFVGRVDVGPLRIVVRPKLPALPLTRLLRYAYGLRDLGMPLDETAAPTTRHGLHDILVALLLAEAEELLHRGLARQYVPRVEALDSPRGRILIRELARQGGAVQARLPCRHMERRADWLLNQVLHAGLDMAAGITADTGLRHRAHRLAARFDGVAGRAGLVRSDLDRAEQMLTRLTAVYAPALGIIRLLLDAQGMAFEPPGQAQRVPGFLFDMNLFFQRLLSRFLHEHLPAGQQIEDERTVRGVFAYAPNANPLKRAAPSVRPDYALVQDGALVRFLDAKYRDTWNHGCPTEWLYQLSTYALASPDRVSVLLYATMADNACEERMEVRPAVPWSGQPSATFVLRPAALGGLAQLVVPDARASRSLKQQQYASELVSVGAAGRRTFSESRERDSYASME